MMNYTSKFNERMEQNKEEMIAESQRQIKASEKNKKDIAKYKEAIRKIYKYEYDLILQTYKPCIICSDRHHKSFALVLVASSQSKITIRLEMLVIGQPMKPRKSALCRTKMPQEEPKQVMNSPNMDEVDDGDSPTAHNPNQEKVLINQSHEESKLFNSSSIKSKSSFVPISPSNYCPQPVEKLIDDSKNSTYAQYNDKFISSRKSHSENVIRFNCINGKCEFLKVNLEHPSSTNLLNVTYNVLSEHFLRTKHPIDIITLFETENFLDSLEYVESLKKSPNLTRDIRKFNEDLEKDIKTFQWSVAQLTENNIDSINEQVAVFKNIKSDGIYSTSKLMFKIREHQSIWTKPFASSNEIIENIPRYINEILEENSSKNKSNKLFQDTKTIYERSTKLFASTDPITKRSAELFQNFQNGVLDLENLIKKKLSDPKNEISKKKETVSKLYCIWKQPMDQERKKADEIIDKYVSDLDFLSICSQIKCSTITIFYKKLNIKDIHPEMFSITVKCLKCSCEKDLNIACDRYYEKIKEEKWLQCITICKAHGKTICPHYIGCFAKLGNEGDKTFPIRMKVLLINANILQINHYSFLAQCENCEKWNKMGKGLLYATKFIQCKECNKQLKHKVTSIDTFIEKLEDFEKEKKEICYQIRANIIRKNRRRYSTTDYFSRYVIIKGYPLPHFGFCHHKKEFMICYLVKSKRAEIVNCKECLKLLIHRYNKELLEGINYSEKIVYRSASKPIDSLDYLHLCAFCGNIIAISVIQKEEKKIGGIELLTCPTCNRMLYIGAKCLNAKIIKMVLCRFLDDIYQNLEEENTEQENNGN